MPPIWQGGDVPDIWQTGWTDPYGTSYWGEGNKYYSKLPSWEDLRAFYTGPAAAPPMRGSTGLFPRTRATIRARTNSIRRRLFSRNFARYPRRFGRRRYYGRRRRYF